MILAPFLTSLCASSLPATEVLPSGSYAEARTASVFAGACHYNGELMSDGREALLGWRFESGSVAGVDLSGLSLSALIVDDQNLSTGSSRRRSVIYVPSTAGAPERLALEAWVTSAHGDVLGDVLAVRACDLSVEVAPETFALVAPGTFDLRGNALPDRACCKMPYQVWYAPFEDTTGRLVGRNERFDVVEPLLALRWSRPGENAAFFGRFGPAPSASR
jgi:hypothetical protein